MFSSILRTNRSKRRRTRTDTFSFAPTLRTVTPPRGELAQESDAPEDIEQDQEEEESTDSSEDENLPLLPIFDASVLDGLPTYNLTLTFRTLVSEKCETVLSWEQLRSPQVSQFLLKPIQQEIRANYFSAATLYALMANSLQFTKEIDSTPGNSGTSATRALICELLAIKMLREYTTRGLIDALSYDFDPLQGQSEPSQPNASNARTGWQPSRKAQPKSARISCLEVAIRAQAKRFLAHPLVVQQLQAIWNGSIVFHNAADNMHRRLAARLHTVNYGTSSIRAKPKPGPTVSDGPDFRRKLVTLYNPRDASLLKLSRLRVPRYRNILSTTSYAVLLGLFVAVLVQRSVEITALEVCFWFWAAGYMLDEVVGFNEQGFGLYIASFWNTFDLGIVLLLLVHLCLRIYGIVSPAAHKHSTAYLAYDILAADAILLFPRLFSVLDHYRYFSQLIIAFRLMAADLMAVCILIVIACSGFFVALSLSFGQDSPDDPKSVGFALLQLLLGFTPAAWDRWDLYTPLGRGILVLFMFITHFVVVTILITVLTNSFMAVVKNAHEEHQFLFAVNTISSVKSDSLFSYVAPLNVLQWLLTPLRYLLPFRQFIQWNRTVIKLTHFPVLFFIYLYERTILQTSIVDRIDMVETYSRNRKTLRQRLPRLVREPSMATFKQDQALEEVFKRPLDDTLRTTFGENRQKSSLVVSQWMNEMEEDAASPPEEQDPKIVHRLERRRPGRRQYSAYTRARNTSRRAMSVVSDPADVTSHAGFFSPRGQATPSVQPNTSQLQLSSQHDDADGEDDLASDGDEVDIIRAKGPVAIHVTAPHVPEYFTYQPGPRSMGPDEAGFITSASRVDTKRQSRHSNVAPNEAGEQDIRRASSSTAVAKPPLSPSDTFVPSANTFSHLQRSEVTRSGAASPRSKQNSISTSRKTAQTTLASPIRPVLLEKKTNPAFRSTPNIRGSLEASRQGTPDRRPSLEMDLVSDIGDNKALGGGYVGAIPANIATQMALASNGLRQLQQERQEEQERLSRLVMARMNSLEEGFREIIHEMREKNKPVGHGKRAGSGDRSPRTPPQYMRHKDRRRLKERQKSEATSGTITGTEDAMMLTKPVEEPGEEKSRRPKASEAHTDATQKE